jgi:hypothetical protein
MSWVLTMDDWNLFHNFHLRGRVLLPASYVRLIILPTEVVIIFSM